MDMQGDSPSTPGWEVRALYIELCSTCMLMLDR